MIDNAFRSILPRFVGPLLRLYKFLKLSPDGVTVLGCLMGIVSSFFVAKEYFVLALALWWLGRLLDGTDGIYAREIGRSSKVGAFLDINCDMLAYGAVILGLYFYRPDLAFYWCVILFLYILCIAGALSLGSLQSEHNPSYSRDNRKLRLAAGLAEGGETGFFYSFCFLFPTYLKPLSIIWIAILALTVVARAILAMKLLSSKESS